MSIIYHYLFRYIIWLVILDLPSILLLASVSGRPDPGSAAWVVIPWTLITHGLLTLIFTLLIILKTEKGKIVQSVKFLSFSLLYLILYFSLFLFVVSELRLLTKYWSTKYADFLAVLICFIVYYLFSLAIIWHFKKKYPLVTPKKLFFSGNKLVISVLSMVALFFWLIVFILLA